MSKAIIRIDIPTDYADEYKQWIIEGRLCYLEDNAWTHLKDVECKVELYREVIPVEWIEKKLNCCDNINAEIFVKSLIRDWRKENGRN